MRREDDHTHVHTTTTRGDGLGGFDPFTKEYVDSRCYLISDGAVGLMHPLPRLWTALLVASTVTLTGCAKSAAEREVADDQSCRRIIQERNDTRPNAYQECRGNLMEYQRQRAVAVSGSR